MNEENGRIVLLNADQDGALIKERILSVLKEQKVSLSQARGVFVDILHYIEDENPMSL